MQVDVNFFIALLRYLESKPMGEVERFVVEIRRIVQTYAPAQQQPTNETDEAEQWQKSKAKAVKKKATKKQSLPLGRAG